MNNFGKMVSKFLTDYIIIECGKSQNTQKSYATTFKLLINYFEYKYEIKLNKLDFEHITKNRILEFLNYLEKERQNTEKTRNQRLAAIKSFMTYVSKNDIEYISLANEILDISQKKTPGKLISYFHEDEIDIFLNYIYKSCNFDKYTLFVVLYETAARITELINIKLDDINLIDCKNATIKLKGKGNKVRNIPIDENVAKILKIYLEKYYIDYGEHYLFYSSHKKKYNRTTINKEITKITMEVKQIHPNLFNGTYSPHCIRHSKAMHLVNNGVPLSTIRAFLGHEVLTSTQIYATPDLNTMRKELEKNSKNLNINIKYTKKEKETLDKFLEEILKK